MTSSETIRYSLILQSLMNSVQETFSGQNATTSTQIGKINPYDFISAITKIDHKQPTQYDFSKLNFTEQTTFSGLAKMLYNATRIHSRN